MAQLGRSCAQLRPNCAPTALQLCRNCTTAVLQVRPSAGAAALTTPSSLGFVLIPIPHPKYEQAKRVYAYVRTYTLVQNRYSHKHIITYSNVHILIYVSVVCFVAVFMQFNIIHIFRCTCFKKLELSPLAVFPQLHLHAIHWFPKSDFRAIHWFPKCGSRVSISTGCIWGQCFPISAKFNILAKSLPDFVLVDRDSNVCFGKDYSVLHIFIGFLTSLPVESVWELRFQASFHPTVLLKKGFPLFLAIAWAWKVCFRTLPWHPLVLGVFLPSVPSGLPAFKNSASQLFLRSICFGNSVSECVVLIVSF